MRWHDHHWHHDGRHRGWRPPRWRHRPRLRRLQTRLFVWFLAAILFAFNSWLTAYAQETRMYELMGLNDREIQILAQATVKRDYYYKSPLGRRLFSFGFGPVTLAFVGASCQQDLRAVRQLMEAHEEDWPAHWLRQRGLPEAARQWQTGGAL